MTSKETKNQPVSGKEAEEHIEHESMNDSSVKAIKESSGGNYRRTILIALDHSVHSERALAWTMDNLLRVDGNDLVVLATVREPVLVPGAYGYMDFGDYIAEAEEQARLRSHALIKKYGQQLLKHFSLPSASNEKLTVKGIVMRGDPRDELVRKATELGASALVMGSRGLGAFKRAFLGSVSDYIVHNSDVPVIIVKATEQDKKNQ